MNRELSAFSVFETLVASVVFLIGMRTLADVLAYRTCCPDPAIMENEMERCRQRYLRSGFAVREAEYDYDWGTIAVNGEPFSGVAGVMLVTVKAVPDKGMVSVYRYLYDCYEE